MFVVSSQFYVLCPAHQLEAHTNNRLMEKLQQQPLPVRAAMDSMVETRQTVEVTERGITLGLHAVCTNISPVE